MVGSDVVSCGCFGCSMEISPVYNDSESDSSIGSAGAVSVNCSRDVVVPRI